MQVAILKLQLKVQVLEIHLLLSAAEQDSQEPALHNKAEEGLSSKPLNNKGCSLKHSSCETTTVVGLQS